MLNSGADFCVITGVSILSLTPRLKQQISCFRLLFSRLVSSESFLSFFQSYLPLLS